MNTLLVYLATPYSHPNPLVREKRFRVVNRVAADLMRKGVHVFSPISHTHPIALAGDLPKGWEFWQEYDRAIMRACDAMIVLKQRGWKHSVGVQAEIALAAEMGLPVRYVGPPRTSTPSQPTALSPCAVNDQRTTITTVTPHQDATGAEHADTKDRDERNPLPSA